MRDNKCVEEQLLLGQPIRFYNNLIKTFLVLFINDNVLCDNLFTPLAVLISSLNMAVDPSPQSLPSCHHHRRSLCHPKTPCHKPCQYLSRIIFMMRETKPRTNQQQQPVQRLVQQHTRGKYCCLKTIYSGIDIKMRQFMIIIHIPFFPLATQNHSSCLVVSPPPLNIGHIPVIVAILLVAPDTIRDMFHSTLYFWEYPQPPISTPLI